ncbi:MAG: hypothetical protein ACWGMZ_08830 [Thermoguttaceae bacterium]
MFLKLKDGKYKIGGSAVKVGGSRFHALVGAKPRGLHFVSRATGHRLVQGFQPNDFQFWYDAKVDHPTPLLNCHFFRASGWEPILLSFDQMVAAWKPDGKGHWCISQIELSGRTEGNPVATIFAERLLAQDVSDSAAEINKK